jgi:hypothetical protein
MVALPIRIDGEVLPAELTPEGTWLPFGHLKLHTNVRAECHRGILLDIKNERTF